MAINDTATTTFFRYHYHCTGNEKNLTDCTISAVNATFRNQICASNEVIGIDCVTGTDTTSAFNLFTLFFNRKCK